MGWKSTIEMTREQMEVAVHESDRPLNELTDEELADLLELLRGGEDHGANYRVIR